MAGTKYRSWPDVDRDVQDRVTLRFTRLIAKCGSSGKPSMLAVGIKEGLGAQVAAWISAGLLDAIDSERLWEWVEGQVIIDGAYVGKDPSWSWRTILDKLDKGRHLKVKQQGQSVAAQALESKLDTQQAEARRKMELEDRASDGDIDAMRELYGQEVVDSYLRSCGER